VSGVAAARFLATQGWDIVVYDDDEKKLSEADTAWERLESKELPQAIDLLVVSPGVPRTHRLVVAAREKGIDIVGEMELAARFLAGEQVIAVTGTNGKSTTVTLVHEMLTRDGRKSAVAGNIGEPLISFVGKAYEFLVVEVSSFQLETLSSLVAAAVAILNVSPDHLDRYADYEEYLMTKVHLARLVAPGGVVAVNGCDGLLCSAVERLGKAITYFSVGGRSDVAFGEQVVSYRGVEVIMNQTRLRGKHNVENLMAAMILAHPFMKEPSRMADAAYAFNPLPHRMTPAGKVGGVEFIDDSKGTNVGAVEKSLVGFPDKSVVLILGGVDKGGSYQPIRAIAETKCRGVVLMGAARPIIRQYFDGFSPLEEADSMTDAVEKAYRLAKGSGFVLLSPACSSFDMYRNYKERGDDFVRRVADLREREKQQQ